MIKYRARKEVKIKSREKNHQIPPARAKKVKMKNSEKIIKYRACSPKVATAELEHPKSPREVAISVADDRELDALQ